MRRVRPKEISDAVRNDMVADSLVLAYGVGTNLATTAVIEAISNAMAAAEDPLQKIWIETHEGKKHTYSGDDAIKLQTANDRLNYLSAFPDSERGNGRTRWMTMATAFNNSPNSRTLFFGLPSSQEKEYFGPHLVLLRSLVSRGLIPEYGFGFHREYGFGPDYFAIGHVYNTTTREVASADWHRIGAWASERAGSPQLHPLRFRQSRGLILDVFPLNVLTDVHLAQSLHGVSLKTWINEATGVESLIALSDRCFVWLVPMSALAGISETLDEAGLIIASPPKLKRKKIPE